MIIELKQVSKSYGALKVLDKVNMTAQPGDFLAVYGPSGAGKTTLLNLVGTLDFPDEGAVIVAGVDIGKAPEAVINKMRSRDIGFAYQSSYMFNFLTVEENILFSLRLAGLPAEKEKVREILAELGLEKKIQNKPAQLSYGERKRAAIARALVKNPRIILADEPTANLDAENKTKVLALLLQRCRDGATVIVATHDPEIKEYARVVKLENGRLEG